MTAATEPRDTPSRTGASMFRRTVLAGDEVFQGTMGFQRPVSATMASSPTVASFVLGLLADSGAGGDSVNVRRGTFRFANSSGADEITLADVGKDCFAVDNQTVSLTDASGTRPKAGRIFDVDAGGVWVEFS